MYAARRVRPGSEQTPEGFQISDGPYLFIAGSSDMDHQRGVAERAARQALWELGCEDIRVYSWDIETGPQGLDQRRPMQKNLLRPADENCVGVICLVGEKIGLPMDDSFERTTTIANLVEWTDPAKPFRVEPRWPLDQVEAQALLDSGAVPLTGSVFEFVDAYGAGKPVWLGLLAAESVKPGGKDIVLNNRDWFSSKTDGLDADALKAFHDGEYQRQTRGVYNFMRLLATRAIAQHPTQSDAQLTDSVKAFVGREVIATGSQRNPYRHLGYYDISDGSAFVGREVFVQQAVQTLESRFSEGLPVMRVVGPSGSGKSSVLRAGILHCLLEPEMRDRYRVATLRPENFQDDAGQQMRVATVIVEQIALQAGLSPSLAQMLAVERRGAGAPAAAAALISSAVAQCDPDIETRLVIGLDQFEEMVDVLGGGLTGERWQPLLDFVNVAAQTRNIGFVYTLESSRIRAHDALDLGPAFAGAAVKVLDNAREFIQTIIDRPFRRARLALAEDVIKTLTTNLFGLQREDPWQEETALPLLALKLTQLFDFVSERFERRYSGVHTGLKTSDRDDGSITVKALESENEDLGFAHVIQQQAELAWRRGSGSAKRPTARDVENFLQPFVAADSDKVQLTSASRRPPFQSERALVDSFYKYHLLIGSSDDRVRLVHEAVLRYWPDARTWRDARGPFLQTKEKLRLFARAWAASRRDARPSTQPEPTLIGEAAAVLRAYLRHWSLDLTNIKTDEERLMYDYLATVFQHSETPAEVVDSYPQPANNHVGLAACYGMVELLEKFYGKDPTSLELKSPTLENGDWVRPLHAAAWAQPETVRYLLKRGVEPIAKSGAGWPAIVGAIMQGTTASYFPLIEAAAGVATEPLEDVLLCPGGQTLLHMCGAYNQVHIARDLIERHGFSPTRKSDFGWLPIHNAASAGSAALFDLFRNYSSATEQTTTGATCLHLAAGAGRTNIVDRILASREAPTTIRARDNVERTALHYAAQNLQSESVVDLLRHLDPCDVDVLGEQPIHRLFAIRDIDQDRLIETLRALLADERTDPNAEISKGRRKGYTPLRLARPFPRAQRVLLEDPRTNLAQPIGTDATGISIALRLGVWVAVRRYMIEHPPGENTVIDAAGNTILHLLARRAAPLELAESLLANLSAELINARNKEGETPLWAAINAGNWSLAMRILRSGRVTPTTTDSIWHILHALQSDAPPDALATLLDVYPQSIAAPDGHGWTLLHWICVHGQPDWLERLKPYFPVDDDLWSRPDLLGRRPVDLANEAMRASVGRTGGQLPRPVNWDHDLAWAPLQNEDLDVLKQQLGSASRTLPPELDPDLAGASVHRSALSFYPDCDFLRITSAAWTPGRSVYYVRMNDRPYRLDGALWSIFLLNAAVSIRLTADNVLDYVRFYCFFVRVGDGPFVVVESPDQPEFAGKLGARERATLERLAHPSWLIDEQDGVFRVAVLRCVAAQLSGVELEIGKYGLIKPVAGVVLDDRFAKVEFAPIT
jgi:ankyrin repeat protein